MSFLWDGIKDAAGRMGSAAGKASIKAKLKADLLFIDREILARQQSFGVELYDYVAPLAKNPAFYSSDDTLTVTLQPPLISAQREIAVLEIKKGKSQEKINQAAVTRAGAFTPATTWQDKIVNTAKSTALAGNEAKNSTEMSLINAEIKHHKQQFGVDLYKRLEELEDTQQFLPSDREIRSIYDNCRRDIEKARERKVAKEAEIKELDGGGTYNANQVASRSMPSASVTVTQAQPVVYPSQSSSYSVPVPAPPAPVVPAYSVQQQPTFPAAPPAPVAPDPFSSQQQGGHDPFTAQQQQQPFAAAAAPAADDPFSLAAYAAQKQQQPPPMGSSEPQSFMSSPQQQQHGMSSPQQQQLRQNLTMAPDPFASLSSQPMGGQSSQPNTGSNDPFSPDYDAFGSSSPAPAYQDPFASLQ